MSIYHQILGVPAPSSTIKREELHLTPEEYTAITRNYPTGNQLYYIWVGILVCRGYKIPFTFAELNIKHVEKFTYLVNVQNGLHI